MEASPLSRSADTQQWEREISAGQRFGFGENWAAYLRHLDDHRVELAEMSIKMMLETDRLDGKRFLDIGSGSGLFSLAARRLGAKVTSFDYDPQSVACTLELRGRFYPEEAGWDVCEGSALDQSFLSKLGTFDVVYSWGVLHHTGAMWQALDNAASLVVPGGRLFVAIYNDQGRNSRIWRAIKKTYVAAPWPVKWVVFAPAFIRLWGPTFIRDFLGGHPLRSWSGYGGGSARGMHPWRDTLDWVGGYPFEVAKPEEIFAFCRHRGFDLLKMKTCAGGIGCNEFVFARHAD
jgi:2-polyprenyl-6-hydroxyphenyl methylase/3-demethylubiquinone-9 3-methyltransferase